MPTHANIERAAAKIEQAKTLAAHGFANEARRKEALECLSRAYGYLREAVRDATWAAVRDRGQQTEDRDWDLSCPFELHNLRAKHTEYAIEMAPSMRDTIDTITTIKALRDEYRAMALTPKVKAPMVIKSGDKTQQRGHCQLCGRVHAVNGVVAKHGYEIKDRGNYGYFRGICPGHQYAPMEIDRKTTDETAEAMRQAAQEGRALAERLKSGFAWPAAITRGFGTKTEKVDFKDGTTREKAEAVRNAIANEEGRARHLDSSSDQLQTLASAVYGKPLLIVKV